MAIKHSTVATSPDEEGAEVNKTEWNDDHVIDDYTLSIAKTSGLQAILDVKETVFNVLLKANIASPTFTGTVVLPNVPAIITTQLNTKQATITDGDLTIARTNGLQAAIDAKATLISPSLSYAINAQTGTTYTAVLADAGKIITCNNGSAITFTIPPNSGVAYPTGSSLTIISIGAGLTTFAQGAGVTITSVGASAAAPIMRAQHSSATAIKIAINSWAVIGDIE